MWQTSASGVSYGLETCGSMSSLTYTGAPVSVTWSNEINTMWKLNGNPLDWTRPRQQYGVAVKTSAGNPVSDYNGWNWSGENPAHWYPMNLRFTVVVVEAGKTFSGWQNYP